MDLRQLRHFIVVADTGSLTRAADQLGLAQPALSRDIRSLEDDLAARLFLRTGRGVTLTQVGAQFLDAARPHLEGLDEARQTIRLQGATPPSVIRLGWTGTISAPLGADIVERCKSELPGVDLETIGGSSAQILELLDNGGIDLGIVNSEQPAKGGQSEHLMRCDLFHISRSQRNEGTSVVDPILFRDAAASPLLLFGRQHALRRAIDSAARHHGIELKVHAQIDEFQAMRRMILESGAATILPLTLVGSWTTDPTLAKRRVIEPTIALYYRVVFPNAEVSPIVSGLARLIHRVVRQALAEGRVDGRL